MQALRNIFLTWFMAMILVACVPFGNQIPLRIAQQPTPTSLPAATATLPPTLEPSATPLPTATPEPTPTFVPVTPTATTTPLSVEQQSEVFTQVWELIRDRYVYSDYRGLDWNAVREEFAPRVAAAATTEEFYTLMYELIDRLGDEHTRFVSPREVADEQARFNGELSYGGIGASVRAVSEGGLITQLANGGPAEEAGLQIRDIIVQVEGIDFNDPTAFGPGGPLSEVRGIPGTYVNLSILSPDGAIREVPVVRRIIESEAFSSVKAQLLPGTQIGLLTIDTFFVDALDQRVREQLETLTEDQTLEGLIIDVRGNGGGRVDLMLATIGLFVDGGSIGNTAGRNRSSELTVPSGTLMPQFANVPMVVLTGSETVSAAEMFAAGLQVLDRARTVGTASAGNTENLLSHELVDGSRLWLAELAYQLPNGELIEGRGVQPDIEVDTEWWRYTPSEDPQIQAALDTLSPISESEPAPGSGAQ
ncbi:MAG: PDZ domain-containing protein [Chloroflexi bacterium AL-W]|nr:PDZ domain-containing protein [Chloroflexi bacterium AL-N1]NOK68033.1 PDZ domain-containing protein [Chloroflexi bacterium AL-N10]NOK73373.1 PDZ domain-containing protein [Chloroflexi bacterium AL-N5]NOK83287.1 PDZ domain-containing protein [Chloroflexi bacterium AL-W]NOK87704.1 PDZ domain-containing protein [Chloroflexi bacterium AL-N15]